MNKLWVRLSILFGIFALFGAVTIAIAARVLVNDTVQDRFLPEQLQAQNGLIETLAEHYQREESWAGVEALMLGAQAASAVGSPNGLEFLLQDAEGQIVYVSKDEEDHEGKNGNEREMQSLQTHRKPFPIQIEGEDVGYLHARPHRPRITDGSGRTLLHFLSSLLLLVAIGGGIIGVLFGILSSRNLTAPLSRLAKAAHEVGIGNYSRRVEVSGSDEVQEVAYAFNEMTKNLAEAEDLRRNLMADVAHELRTPLTVIQGNLRALLDDVFPLEKSEIARLYDQTRILSRLVDDLREIAQAEAGQLQLNLQTMDMEKLIRDTATTFGPIAERDGITLQAVIDEKLLLIQGDAMRLSQILHNLIQNALRHTPSEGTITIEAYNRERERGLETVVQIKDTGSGIEPEHLPFIFDRFYRIHKARDRTSGGTGLGLAIVQALTEAHGGQVSVTSDGLGKGSIFTIRLPHDTPH